MYDFTDICITSDKGAQLCADILREKIKERTGAPPREDGAARVRLSVKGGGGDGFSVKLSGNSLEIAGESPRALIYGAGLFLRKTVYENGKITLISDISGEYKPSKRVRGHQLGYRACSNTYDAWKLDDYKSYMLDIMLFGANMAEFIPEDTGNELMCERGEMLKGCVAAAKQLGLDVSLWYPNDSLSAADSAKHRRQVLSEVPETDVLFIPGSDPGDYKPTELFDRLQLIAEEIRDVCKAQVWVSAQAPHDSPEWGEEFISCLEKLPGEIHGVIMGPNHAMELAELRRRTPERYPIRLYNDITHNVRCEYPVHYKRDDWHFSLAAVNGRESINPRPVEFAALHAETSPYIIGSCSYSEGVNDDVNKMLWSALDFCEKTPVKELLEDYSRLFFPGIDAATAARGILMLEKNWDCDSAENPRIEKTLELFRELERANPELSESWRFNSLLFRAVCDAVSRRRRIFELKLIKKAREKAENGCLEEAYRVLCTEFDSEYKELRADASQLAGLLYGQIGLQLDVKNFHASSWERGATLESLDLPVTDRAWLRGRLEGALSMGENGLPYAMKCFKRNETGEGEKYFSVALDGVIGLGAPQKSEVYLNFRGDNPNENNGNLPVCMLNRFDSFTLNAELDGLCDSGYELRVTYTDNRKRSVQHHRVSVNGVVLYDGEGYGGRLDEGFNSGFVPEGFVAVSYDIPAGLVRGSHISLEISEPACGFEICEFWLLKLTEAEK